jgi:hypothetical protein
MLDERSLRYLIEVPTIAVADEEFRLRLVGLNETPENTAMISIAVDGIDERLNLQLSDDLRRDPMALRQRVVYFAKRIISDTRQREAAASAA